MAVPHTPVPMQVALSTMPKTPSPQATPGAAALAAGVGDTMGSDGLAADILSYTARPWGFDLSDVKAKALVIAGQADSVAGHAHAAWYQRGLPDARLEMVPGAGHLVVVPAWARVLSFLEPGALKR